MTPSGRDTSFEQPRQSRLARPRLSRDERKQRRVRDKPRSHQVRSIKPFVSIQSAAIGVPTSDEVSDSNTDACVEVHRIEGAETQGTLKMVDRMYLDWPQIGLQPTAPVPCPSRVRVQSQCLFDAAARLRRDCARSKYAAPKQPSGSWGRHRSRQQPLVRGECLSLARSPVPPPNCRRPVARDTTPRAKAPRDNQARSRLPDSRASSASALAVRSSDQTMWVRSENRVVGSRDLSGRFRRRPLDLRAGTVGSIAPATLTR